MILQENKARKEVAVKIIHRREIKNNLKSLPTDYAPLNKEQPQIPSALSFDGETKFRKKEKITSNLSFNSPRQMHAAMAHEKHRRQRRPSRGGRRRIPSDPARGGGRRILPNPARGSGGGRADGGSGVGRRPAREGRRRRWPANRRLPAEGGSGGGQQPSRGGGSRPIWPEAAADARRRPRWTPPDLAGGGGAGGGGRCQRRRPTGW